jgi:hypothetical protein
MDQRGPVLEERAEGTDKVLLHSTASQPVVQPSYTAVLRQRDQKTLHWLLLPLSVALVIVSAWRDASERWPSAGSDGLPNAYRPRIGVNHCDWPELCLLQGISNTLAQRIVANRQRHGPFGQPKDLERIQGIGPKTSAALARQLDFSCPAMASGEGDTSGTRPLE